jgi:hypothetical protein
VLAAARGFRVSEVVVQHRPRQYGKSKYFMSRFVEAALDLLVVRFVLAPRLRPQHLLASIGLVTLGLGGIGMMWLIVSWGLSHLIAAIAPFPLAESATFYGSLALVAIGSQCLLFALFGDMIASHFVRDADTYSIAEHTPLHNAPSVIPIGKASESS